jgi:DNA-binding CsgD family transcriptional regulator
VFLQRIKRSHPVTCQSNDPTAVQAGAFAFCERASGAIRFQVRADDTGELPIEEAASLLAMHCLVRAQAPEEYMILVVPRQELLKSVGSRAQQLLAAGRNVAGSNIRLSPRQREVLDHVMRDLSNKEIGARLNVTERTVKFHVSRLLAKFKARDRAGLKHEATLGMLPASAVPGDTLFGFVVPPEVAARSEENGAATSDTRPVTSRRPAGLLNFQGARCEPQRAAVSLSSRP